MPHYQQAVHGGVGLADVPKEGVGALVVEVVQVFDGDVEAECREGLPGAGCGGDQGVFQAEGTQLPACLLRVLDTGGQQLPRVIAAGMAGPGFRVAHQHESSHGVSLRAPLAPVRRP